MGSCQDSVNGFDLNLYSEKSFYGKLKNQLKFVLLLPLGSTRQSTFVSSKVHKVSCSIKFQVTYYQHRGETLKATFIADKARKLAVIAILIGAMNHMWSVMEKAKIIEYQLKHIFNGANV